MRTNDLEPLRGADRLSYVARIARCEMGHLDDRQGGREVGRSYLDGDFSNIRCLHDPPCKHVSTYIHITQNVKLNCCRPRTLHSLLILGTVRFLGLATVPYRAYLLAWISSLSIAKTDGTTSYKDVRNTVHTPVLDHVPVSSGLRQQAIEPTKQQACAPRHDARRK
jgi:hypothetical protein